MKDTRGTVGGLELQWQLAEAQILAGNQKEAEALIKDLRGENYPPGKTDFLAALLEIQKQNWPAAEKLLRDGVIPAARDPGTRDWPNVRTQAKYYLVQCYRQLGHNVNEQVRLLQEILKESPYMYQAHAWLAEIYTGQRRTRSCHGGAPLGGQLHAGQQPAEGRRGAALSAEPGIDRNCGPTSTSGIGSRSNN